MRKLRATSSFQLSDICLFNEYKRESSKLIKNYIVLPSMITQTKQFKSQKLQQNCERSCRYTRTMINSVCDPKFPVCVGGWGMGGGTGTSKCPSEILF